MPSDYVYRETKRAVEGVAGAKTQIWPGIDVDIPSGDIPPAAYYMKCTPQSTKDMILAAFLGGGTDLVISRKYSEMTLANLAGVGEVLRELKMAPAKSVCLFLFAAGLTYVQYTSGLEATVVDQSGAAVANAHVVATEREINSFLNALI